MAEEQTEIQEENPPEKSGMGLMGIIKAFAFLSVIVAVQVVGASFLIPSAQETEQLGREIAAAEAGKEASSSSEEEVAEVVEGEGISEVLLGTYNPTRYNPKTGSTLTVDIEIYATMLAEETEDFSARLEKNKGRVGEQVMMTLHSASTAELADPGLGLIKRRILEKTNRALGKPIVREVLFSKFNFVER